jgi:hypothetical protein
LTSNIILIENISDFDVIPKNIIENQNIKKFSFNLDIHELLKSKKIEHEIADNILNENERLQIFDKMIEFREWHSKIKSDDYKIEGINLLKMLDSQEFGSFLIPKLINLITIKRIIENEKPKKIITTTSLLKMIKVIIKNYDIELEFFKNKPKELLFWDIITIKFNIGKIPIKFNISKNTYLKIKTFFEKIMGFIFGFWYNPNNYKKKSLVFLEFNPEFFSNIFKSLKNYDGDIILVNQRRSAVWGRDSLNIIRKSKCKIFKIDNIKNNDEKDKINLLVNQFSKKIDNLFNNSTFFENFFIIDDISFWELIKETLEKKYSQRLFSYISIILNVKHFFDNSDVKCIVHLNEVGETEKSFLEFKNNTPSILLEHGFVERIEKTKRLDSLSNYTKFNDKIAVWGESKKNYLINEYGIDEKKIIVTGSPKHDNYFSSRVKKKNNGELTLLIAPNPISDICGFSSTEIKLRFKEIITNIFSVVKEFDNLKIIVKLHPIQLQHNHEIQLIIKKLDKTIPIFLWTSVIDTINQADAVIVISPDIPGTTTMLLESMILGKPTMNVFFDKQIPEFHHVQKNAVFTVLDDDNFKNNLKKFLFDKKFQNALVDNADNFVMGSLSNPNTASEKFASILKSI